MTSTTQYFKKSMNAIYEIDDGAGTSIADGNITTNSIATSNFNTDNFTATLLNATTANITTGNINNINSYNIASDAIVANTGTINEINSTTGNIGTLNSDTITNSGAITTTYLNIKNGGFVYNGDTSTYSEQFINTDTNIYRYILYPPINRSIWTINGNNILDMDDTKITVPKINSTTINNSGTTTTGTLASTTINNTGTTTTNVLHATTAVISDISGNNSDYNYINATNFTGLNSIIGTLTNQNITALTPTSPANLWTTNTGDINIGGSGTVKIPTLTSTTVNSTTINNSGTATTTTLNTNAIQPK